MGKSMKGVELALSQNVVWRNIAISLIEPRKGEWKAQACDIAWFRQLSRRRSQPGFPRYRIISVLREIFANSRLLPRQQVSSHLDGLTGSLNRRSCTKDGGISRLKNEAQRFLIWA